VARRALAGLKAHERLSIGHYMLRRWSLEEDVRHLERLGFRSISLASTNSARTAWSARSGCCGRRR